MKNMKLSILTTIFLFTLYSCNAHTRIIIKDVRNQLDTLHATTLKGKLYTTEYKVLDIRNSNTGKRELKIIKNKTIIQSSPLPSQYDIGGFSINWIKQTNSGFELSIEYGSRIYYNKVFQFEYRDNNFYLYRIQIQTFDKADPEKIKTEIIDIPDINIRNVKLINYMQ